MIKNLDDYKGKALILTTQEEQVDTPFYESMITEIRISPDMFHKIYPGYYPKKELTNQIGAGMGIDFLPNVRLENVYGDEVTYPDGRKVRPITGLRCFKQGRRMRPDGSYQLSDPQPYEFNWEDRAELDFLADEEKGGKRYGTPTKKRQHVLELKKFATQRAGTGAELAVIRNLTGMPTGFKDADLKSGLMVVSQIVKSKEYQAEEAKAKIDNIRNGGLIADNLNNVAGLLTGNTPDIQDDFNNKFERPEPMTDVTPEPEKPAKKEPVEKVSKEEKEFSDLIAKISPERASHYLTEIEKWKDTDSEIDSLKWAINEIKGLLGK